MNTEAREKYLEILAPELVAAIPGLRYALSCCTGMPILSMLIENEVLHGSVTVDQLLRGYVLTYIDHDPSESTRLYPFEEPDSIQRLIDDVTALV